MEVSLGVALFEGSKNKPQLTAAARGLLPALSAALDQIHAAVVATRVDGARGTLDVACFDTFTVKWLIPRLYGFTALHPDIEVRLSTSGTAAEPGEGRCDLVITADDGQPQGAEVLPLFPERLGVVLSPSLAARFKKPLRAPKDLRGKPLLHTRTRRNAWQMLADAFGCAPPDATGPEFAHYYFTLEAAVGGLGICAAPWHLVIDDLQAGRLVAPLGFRESGYRYVARRRPGLRNPRLDKFCDWLQAQAQLTPLPEEAERPSP